MLMYYNFIYIYDTDGYLLDNRFIGFHATWGWDEWDCFPLPSSQIIVQGRYTVAWGTFEPETLRLQGTERVCSLNKYMYGTYL